MTTIISKIEALSSRLERAKKIVDSQLVERIDSNQFIVLSQQGRAHYNVDDSGCECPDSVQRFDLTKGYCKHRIAVELYKQANPEATENITAEQCQDYVESLYGPQEQEIGRQQRSEKPESAA